MLSVVCFKWHNLHKGASLPSQEIVEYGASHVNTMYNMIKRNLTIPHRFICITDDWEGFYPNIEVIKLWDKCKDLGGCYNRLFVFSESMRKYLGDRFVCIDLDCVITGKLDSLFSRQEDFIINKYDNPIGYAPPKQYYNGGLFMMNVGARKQVWDSFKGQESVDVINAEKQKRLYVGTDQAWISHTLGNGEALFSPKDGVYDYRLLPKARLPEDAKMVFFAGRRDPTTEYKKADWIRRCWQ